MLLGRNDTVYRIECEACSSAVSFHSSYKNINNTKVVVSNLSPSTTYRFLVYAENGASQIAGDSGQFVDITITTESSGKLGTRETSFTLQLRSHATDGLICRPTGYISLVITESDTEQKYSHANANSNGNGTAFIGGDEPGGTTGERLSAFAALTIAAVVLLVVVVTAVVVYVRRSSDECSKKQPSDCEYYVASGSQHYGTHRCVVVGDTLEYTRAGEGTCLSERDLEISRSRRLELAIAVSRQAKCERVSSVSQARRASQFPLVARYVL